MEIRAVGAFEVLQNQQSSYCLQSQYAQYFDRLIASIEQPSPAKVQAPSSSSAMLALFSLLGASALVPLLCSRTGATPITSLPELRDDERLLQPRGPACSQDLPYGRGPNSTVPPLVGDSASVFSTYAPYSLAALAPMSLAVPGYLLVNSNQAAFAQRAGVSTLQWINMASYDVPGCANQCTATAGCKSFDVYFQRSPTVAPSLDSSCPNPPSQCHIVCLLYNGIFTPADMINVGEWRGQFQVVIAGSNLFNKIGI